MSDPKVRNVGVAFGSLIASSTTLICCVLPAVFVSLGAGTAVVALVLAVPQLVWLSEHKLIVFGTVAVLLIGSGAMLWRARQLPCPTDPILARSCIRLRRVSRALYIVSLLFFLIGAGFAFVLPWLNSSGAGRSM